jgi:hypothetical protein
VQLRQLEIRTSFPILNWTKEGDEEVHKKAPQTGAELASARESLPQCSCSGKCLVVWVKFDSKFRQGSMFDFRKSYECKRTKIGHKIHTNSIPAQLKSKKFTSTLRSQTAWLRPHALRFLRFIPDHTMSHTVTHCHTNYLCVPTRTHTLSLTLSIKCWGSPTFK